MKRHSKTLLAVLITFICVRLNAQVEPVDANRLAIGGYDLVAYFTDNQAVKGKKEFTEQYKGVFYQFATPDHQKAFKKNPEKYLPVCDGYCAWGVAEKGAKVPVNPQTFKLIDGKLYLFFNGDFNGTPFNTLTEWNNNETVLLKQLPEKWETLND